MLTARAAAPRGPLTSNIQLLTDDLGNAVAQAPTLPPPGSRAHAVSDRGYDAYWWRGRLLAAVRIPIVPGRRSRPFQPSCNEHLCRARHFVVNCFARLKSACRLATRYEQTVASCATFVALACSLLWFR